jgi:serine/threonine protein kinase
MQLVKSLGHGSYGSVAAFWDPHTNETVAIKKVPVDFSNDLSNGIRALREIRVLASTDHPNIVKMRGFFCDRRGAKHDDIYMIQEVVDIDLHSVIQRSGEHLTDKHHRHILYGTTRGLCYLHSLDIAHRDLKPANVLVNIDCSVKICDFNLSRGGMRCQNGGENSRRADLDHAELSDYVCTRWYRAPELLLFKGRYGKAVDVWSLGCIVCEVITAKPVFKGSSSADQIQKIIQTTGFPSDADFMGKKFLSGVRRTLASLSNAQSKPWQSVLPSASLEAICMISCLLRFSPEKRITAKECLRQIYFSKLYRPSHECGSSSGMDWSFDKLANTECHLREMLCGQGCSFVSQCEADAAQSYE